MKKLTLVLLSATLLSSCGKNEAEQMLYDYQVQNVKAMNFNLEDMEFEIHDVQKVGTVIAADSAEFYKQKLAEYWVGDSEKAAEIADTLSFEFVESALENAIATYDTLTNAYQEALLEVVGTGRYAAEMEYERKRDKALEDKVSYQKSLSEIKTIRIYYDSFAQKPDSVLSAKYRANYSLKNPLLNNAKQTFTKIFYTNGEQTAFVDSEIIEE